MYAPDPDQTQQERELDERAGAPSSSQIAVGDRVRKNNGYPFPGVVVAKFETLAGKTRVVVDCTAPEVMGCLHIYAPEQLSKV